MNFFYRASLISAFIGVMCISACLRQNIDEGVILSDLPDPVVTKLTKMGCHKGRYLHREYWSGYDTIIKVTITEEQFYTLCDELGMRDSITEGTCADIFYESAKSMGVKNPEWLRCTDVGKLAFSTQCNVGTLTIFHQAPNKLYIRSTCRK